MVSHSDTVYTSIYESPVGDLFIAVNRRGIVLAVSFNKNPDLSNFIKIERNRYACGELAYQLDEYFKGERQKFSLETKANGTAFQQSVWHRIRKITYGSTMTYGEIAQKIGCRGSARAVGNAVAANPIQIMIPCHRVLPASGKIGKYAAHSISEDEGSKIKAYLLQLEGAYFLTNS